MCVINYLISKSRPMLPIPRPRGGDSLGIRGSGEVLSGKMSLREAMVRPRVRREAPETLKRPLGLR